MEWSPVYLLQDTILPESNLPLPSSDRTVVQEEARNTNVTHGGGEIKHVFRYIQDYTRRRQQKRHVSEKNPKIQI